MPTLRRFRRRNPRWEEDGPAARREHRLRRLREVAAFLTSLVAVAAAGGMLAMRLGTAIVGRG